ncbi:MAG: Murein hydrolase activator NlpD precursor [Firmicutes bacterium ADurb.Bin506]|jgi:murein DD-endopeptidase MepM/ murein hydrolase activator NlpD|nr:MAG: Murein hydrolase activator NlpD precursor [Firmicutes bacterium ADurb.Bin506]
MVKLRSWRGWKLGRKWLGLALAALACIGIGIVLRLAYEAYWPRVTLSVPDPGAQPVTAVIEEPPAESDASEQEPPPVFSWPADGTVVGSFGWYRDPLRREWRYRDGIALEVPAESAISAAADGEVSEVTALEQGYGVRIKHSYEFETYYASLDTVSVAQGQQVLAGDCIGMAPGGSAKSVIDFKLMLRGEPQDPSTRI